MSMSYKTMQDELINNRFGETSRTSAQYWLNYAYARTWYAEDWIFRRAQGSLVVTAGVNTTGHPTDMVRVLTIVSTDGTRELRYRTPQDYFTLYTASPNPTGLPVDYTVYNGTILVGPYSSETANYVLVYQKKLAEMAVDADIPLIPSEFQYGALVMGALALGLAFKNDFTTQYAENQYQTAMEGLRNGYLVEHGYGLQYGRDSLGSSSY